MNAFEDQKPSRCEDCGTEEQQAAFRVSFREDDTKRLCKLCAAARFRYSDPKPALVSPPNSADIDKFGAFLREVMDLSQGDDLMDRVAMRIQARAAADKAEETPLVSKPSARQKAHDDVVQRMAYHPATKDTAPLFDTVRQIVMHASHELVDIVQPGREASLMLTHLEEALMWASKAIAMTTPVDIDNPRTARVLPAVTGLMNAVGIKGPAVIDEPFAGTMLEGRRCECGKVWLHPDQPQYAEGLIGHTRDECKERGK